MGPHIEYRLATPEDHDLILNFLRDQYYNEGPLIIACRQSTPNHGSNRDHEESSMSHISDKDSATVVAMLGNQIVGVLISGPKTSNEAERWREKASTVSQRSSMMCFQFLALLEEGANIFAKYQVDRAINAYILSVHRDFRRKGISCKLFEKSFQRAMVLGYPVYTMNCMSVYSEKLCQRMGMECMNMIFYRDFRLPGSDKQVLFPPKDHQFAKTYAKRIVQCEKKFEI